MAKPFKILIVLTALFAMTAPLKAQSCAELFRKANSLQENKQYEDAIVYYERAKACDPHLTKDCDRQIRRCRGLIDHLEISHKEIMIPYQGSDCLITITSSRAWQIENESDWCKIELLEDDGLIVQCREPNNSTREKINYFTVKSGSLFQTVKVVQAARPEYIDVGATSLAFPANGTEQVVPVASNARWDVMSVPSWCKIEKADTIIRIIVSPNDQIIDRTDDIIIYSPSEKVVVKIFQGAGNENLTLSQSELHMLSEGDVRYVRVYTDADNWYVGDFPNWINVQKVGTDSLRIQCSPNNPTGEIRSGSVQVRTDRQNVGVMVTQAARMPVNYIFPDSTIIPGRNFSLGVSASYYTPFVSASAGGRYVGSVVDYSLGTSRENAQYRSALGYSFGLYGDIRLYKNIFLQVGANFTQVKYNNTFNHTSIVITPHTSYKYLKGEVQNAYTESYSHTMVELPILASYRFKTGDVSHVQLNFGPVLNIGLKANMNLSGNSDSETLKLYNSFTHERVDNANYVRHTGVNADFNLYQPCVMWTETYSTGNDADVPHHNKFTNSPLNKVNCGLRLGVAYELAGLSFGVSYTAMVSNMANKGYWENTRWAVLNESDMVMTGYRQGIHTLEFKLAYTLRYLKNRK